jgi:glycine cleavage system H protein
MTTRPNHYKYTKDHEWLKIEGNTATIGVTDHAVEQMGDIVHVELPPVGNDYTKGGAFAAIESVKSVSDAYTPVSGRVVEVNTALTDNSGLINQDPFSEGWIVKLTLSNLAEVEALMSVEQYEEFLKNE